MFAAFFGSLGAGIVGVEHGLVIDELADPDEHPDEATAAGVEGESLGRGHGPKLAGVEDFEVAGVDARAAGLRSAARTDLDVRARRIVERELGEGPEPAKGRAADPSWKRMAPRLLDRVERPGQGHAKAGDDAGETSRGATMRPDVLEQPCRDAVALEQGRHSQQIAIVGARDDGDDHDRQTELERRAKGVEDLVEAARPPRLIVVGLGDRAVKRELQIGQAGLGEASEELGLFAEALRVGLDPDRLEAELAGERDAIDEGWIERRFAADESEGVMLGAKGLERSAIKLDFGGLLALTTKHASAVAAEGESVGGPGGRHVVYQ